jgi:tripartite ATP-independent transporter DctP family solute receptor
MKRILVLVLLVAMVAGVAPVFSSGSTEGGVTTVRLGHIRDAAHPTHLGALRFAELVREQTDGRIDIRVFPNSQLGNVQEMFTQLQTGDLDMVYGGINTLAFIDGGEALEITAIPFLYRDYEHMRAALTSDFFAPVLRDAEEATGLRIVNIAGDTAPRGLTANRPIRTPADFDGLQIRTAASEVVLRVMDRLGAVPQQIAFGELYVALSTGVVDAQENGAITVVNMSFYEVQDYYMRTDYIRDIETFYASPAFWDGLSDEDKAIIMAASDEAGELVTTLTEQQLAQAYNTLGQSITVIEEPELDLPAIRAELEGVFDDWDGDKWPAGLLEQIRNLD